MTEDQYIKKVGENIRKMRLKKGIKQVQLAYECGFEGSNMRRIEAGQSNLTLRTLYKIAKVLEVAPDDLLHIEAGK